MEILWAVLILGGFGAGFGFLLTLASRGLTQRAAPQDGAPPLGTGGDGEPDPARAVRMTALVRCSGGLRAHNKYEYEGLTDCTAAMRIGGGSPKACDYGCIGLGTCVSACPFGAISMVDGVAVVDHERCTGCLECTAKCPKQIIIPVPYYCDVNVACSSREKGTVTSRVCDIGCLGCRRCEKICRNAAIQIIGNLAVIDYDKCTGCGDCAEKCPRKLIVDAKLDRAPRMLSEEV